MKYPQIFDIYKTFINDLLNLSSFWSVLMKLIDKIQNNSANFVNIIYIRCVTTSIYFIYVVVFNLAYIKFNKKKCNSKSGMSSKMLLTTNFKLNNIGPYTY